MKKKSCSTSLRDQTHKVQKKFQYVFGQYGVLIANNPAKVIFISIVVVGLCSLGFLRYKSESAPEELWSAKSSEFRKQKTYFDQEYGPFYRINCAIVTMKGAEGQNVATAPFLLEFLELHNQVANLTVYVDGYGDVTYRNVCSTVYADSPCILQTAMDYWLQQDNEKNSTWNATEIAGMTDAQIGARLSEPARKSPLGNGILSKVV